MGVDAADATTAPRARCLRCWRPQDLCLCAAIPCVPTRTHLCVLQHARERQHPFNTARLLGLALPNARVHVARAGGDGSLLTPVELPADAAVLYPHPLATDLAELPPAEHPSTLVVLDGTWAQARRLYRHNPWLTQLRHVRLHPDAPSRYRIRPEPRDDYISTLEATVAALRILEPDTPGLDGLLAMFDHMIDGQLAALARQPRHGRHKRPRQRDDRRLSPLLAAPDLVVVYAETALPGGVHGAPRELVQWCAVRLEGPSADVPFEVLVRPAGAPPSDLQLAHYGFDAGLLAREGVPLAIARERFAAFAGPHATLAAWSQSCVQAGQDLFGLTLPATTLKFSYNNLRSRTAGVLEDVLAREGLTAAPLHCHGRAGPRLGNALAVARWLRRQVDIAGAQAASSNGPARQSAD